MASLTAYWKPVEKAEATAVAAAAGGSTAPASPAKPTAASRKRKSNASEKTTTAADEADEADENSNAMKEDKPATSSSSTTTTPKKKEEKKEEEEAEVPAKKARLESSLEALIPSSWKEVLKAEFTKSYWPAIDKFLKKEEAASAQVFPPRSQIFRALELCPFEQVRVVILGQDPYHDDGQAEGLCFSVPPTVKKIPSSLNNIYKELKDDLGEKAFKKPTHGNLVKWAEQGILLLNTGLTVQAHKANSHKSCGWFNFTDAIIKAINKERRGVVFLLWGKHAQDKAKMIDPARHHILTAAHPSGLSASKGFYGCKHFSKTNALLTKDGNKPINWQV